MNPESFVICDVAVGTEMLISPFVVWLAQIVPIDVLFLLMVVTQAPIVGLLSKSL